MIVSENSVRIIQISSTIMHRLALVKRFMIVDESRMIRTDFSLTIINYHGLSRAV